MLVTLLDEYVPYIAGCEIHDHPFAPICKPCRDAGRMSAAMPRRSRGWPAKSATWKSSRRPDVTIADMIGDIDPIKAARTGRNHFGSS